MRKFDWWGCAIVVLAYFNGYMDGKIAAHREHIRHELRRCADLARMARTAQGK